MKGTFYDGFKPYDGTTSVLYQDGKLVLNVEHYLTMITAMLKYGQLLGIVSHNRAGPPRNTPSRRLVMWQRPPLLWICRQLPVPGSSRSIVPPPREWKAFRFIVQQNGADVAASILRVGGDTGADSGTHKDGKWALSHFGGSCPGVIEVSLTKDGTLEILQNGARSKPTSDANGSNAGSYQAVSASSSKSYGEASSDIAMPARWSHTGLTLLQPKGFHSPRTMRLTRPCEIRTKSSSSTSWNHPIGQGRALRTDI